MYNLKYIMSHINYNYKYSLQNTKKFNELYNEQFKVVFSKFLDDGNYILGDYVYQFEHNFKKYLNVNFCIGVSNCTVALEQVFINMNLTINDEIIIQSNTFIATALGCSRTNSKLILCDVDDNGLLDLNLCSKLITNNTKVIIVTHLYGDCCNIEQLSQLCTVNNIKLIEDCAQCTGTKYNGRHLGTFGDYSCHSFYPSKNLGSLGDAGMICVKSEQDYNNIIKLRNLGSTKKYIFDVKGTNARISSIQCALLNIKLKDLDSLIEIKQQKIKFYLNLLDTSKFKHIKNNNINVYHSYHLFVIQLVSINRDNFQSYMNLNSIETIIHYPIPFYKTEAYKELNYVNCINTEFLCNNIISIPFDYTISYEDITYIANVMNNYQN